MPVIVLFRPPYYLKRVVEQLNHIPLFLSQYKSLLEGLYVLLVVELLLVLEGCLQGLKPVKLDSDYVPNASFLAIVETV